MNHVDSQFDYCIYTVNKVVGERGGKSPLREQGPLIMPPLTGDPQMILLPSSGRNRG